MNEVASQVAVNLMLSSPNYIVFFVGFIICSQRWHVHPRVSFVLLCSLLALTIASVLANVGMPVAGECVRMNGGTPDQAYMVTGVVRAVVAIPYALGFALMLYAALAEREVIPPTASPGRE